MDRSLTHNGLQFQIQLFRLETRESIRDIKQFLSVILIILIVLAARILCSR